MTGDPSPVAPVPASVAAPPEPRQRWRITFARDPVPADAVGRVALEAWSGALSESGLPVAGSPAGDGTVRPRIAFAAPLPAVASGNAELVDVWLLERLPIWVVREALATRLPGGHRWVGAEDIWLAAPPLAGRVAAADWRVELATTTATPEQLAEASRRLLSVRSLPRIRRKGSSEKRYDLRPLLAELAIEPGGPPGSSRIRMRTRFEPELGSGRPEEVVAALGEVAGVELEVESMVRVRLILADE